MLFALTAAAIAQTPESTTTSAASEPELPAEVRAALAVTQDFSFNFDQPGFYAVLEFVKRSPRSPGFVQPPVLVEDWRDLLERPGDFRGRTVTIEGVVGRNRDPYTLESRRDLGQLWQLELRRDDQPLVCTLVLTESAADVPLGASLTATGYFVMIRAYYDAGKRVRHAVLLVAPGPTAISRVAPGRTSAGGLDWRWVAGAVAVGAVVTLVLLRWSAGQRRRDVRTLRASREAPVSLADDLARWAEREHRDDH